MPTAELRIIYEFVTKQREWGRDVMDAILKLVSWGYDLFDRKDVIGSTEEDGIKAMEQLLADDSPEVKSFVPGLWLTVIGFALQLLLKKINK